MSGISYLLDLVDLPCGGGLFINQRFALAAPRARHHTSTRDGLCPYACAGLISRKPAPVSCTSQTPCAMSANGMWKRVLEFCLFGPCGYNLGGYVGPNPQAFMEILKEQQELQENCRPLGRYFMFFNNANSGLESHMSANKIYLVFILSCVR